MARACRSLLGVGLWLMLLTGSGAAFAQAAACVLSVGDSGSPADRR